MSEKEYNALRDALASAAMEGFTITKQTEQDCIRLMTGEVTVADIVSEILSRDSKAI